MGETRACRGKGILKAKFQTPVSPWVKLHREIFWQNTKGTEMKAEPRIYIANGICPGGTVEPAPEGGPCSGGQSLHFQSWLEVWRPRGASPVLKCCGRADNCPLDPPASPGALRVLIRAGQTPQKHSGVAHLNPGCRRICWSRAGWAMTRCQGI